jgi:hypothetical protein
MIRAIEITKLILLILFWPFVLVAKAAKIIR